MNKISKKHVAPRRVRRRHLKKRAICAALCALLAVCFCVSCQKSAQNYFDVFSRPAEYNVSAKGFGMTEKVEGRLCVDDPTGHPNQYTFTYALPESLSNVVETVGTDGTTVLSDGNGDFARPVCGTVAKKIFGFLSPGKILSVKVDGGQTEIYTEKGTYFFDASGNLCRIIAPEGVVYFS